MGIAARKKKNKNPMGDYVPTDEQRDARLWCHRNNIVKIAPKAAAQGNNNNEWYVEVFTNGRWNQSPKKFGPVEIWEVIFNYYKYYYDKYYDDN